MTTAPTTAPAATPTATTTTKAAGASPALRQATQVAATFLVGLAAGFFYTYEASVTPALAEVDDLTYVTMFQSINATIRNPLFGTVFFGSIVALVVALATNWNAGLRTRVLVGTATALYLATFLITFSANVPLNDELAELVNVTVDSAPAARAEFETDWNRFNLLRTVPVVASFLCLTVAGFLGGRTTSD